MSCPFLRDNAVYLLGALDPDERQRYEAHLSTCDVCSRTVREMAGIPGLLARLTPDQVAAAEDEREEPPPALLTALLRAAGRERRRSRWRVAAVSGVAAACVGAIGAGVVVHETGPPPPQGVTLQAVGGLPVSGSARISDRPWGTQIEMRCEYDGWYSGSAPVQYVLVVHDDDGEMYTLNTWKVIPGHPADVTGTTALPRDQIAAIEVRTTDGVTVLHADL
jgi:hypothetical protein